MIDERKLFVNLASAYTGMVKMQDAINDALRPYYSCVDINDQYASAAENIFVELLPQAEEIVVDAILDMARDDKTEFIVNGEPLYITDFGELYDFLKGCEEVETDDESEV